jgi:hypothetical protein
MRAHQLSGCLLPAPEEEEEEAIVVSIIIIIMLPGRDDKYQRAGNWFAAKYKYIRLPVYVLCWRVGRACCRVESV